MRAPRSKAVRRGASSSYSVHTKAVCAVRLSTRGHVPTKSDPTPCLSVLCSALTISAARPRPEAPATLLLSCSRVRSTSNGWVRTVAAMAASTPEERLTSTCAELGVQRGSWLERNRHRQCGCGCRNRQWTYHPCCAARIDRGWRWSGVSLAHQKSPIPRNKCVSEKRDRCSAMFSAMYTLGRCSSDSCSFSRI